jgi:hypothetical protein
MIGLICFVKYFTLQNKPCWEEAQLVIWFYGSLLLKCSLQVLDFFAKLIQRVSPKSYQQALAEVQVSQKFLENFCGDQVFHPLFASLHTHTLHLHDEKSYHV